MQLIRRAAPAEPSLRGVVVLCSLCSALRCAAQRSVCVYVCVYSVCVWAVFEVTVVICGVSSHEPSGTRAEVSLQVPTLGTRIFRCLALPCFGLGVLGRQFGSEYGVDRCSFYKDYTSASSCHAASYRPVSIISIG